MPISFPGLFGDWEFTASPKMLNIGHGVYWYGFLIALGLMVALWFCMKQSKRFGITEDNVLDLVLWGTPAGILGARLYYVIFYWSLFQNGYLGRWAGHIRHGDRRVFDGIFLLPA